MHASKGYLSADIDQGPTMDSLLRDILHPHIDPSKMADSKPCHVVVRILWFLLDDRLQHSLQFVVPRINPPWFFGFTDSFLPRSVIEKKKSSINQLTFGGLSHQKSLQQSKLTFASFPPTLEPPGVINLLQGNFFCENPAQANHIFL